jgi:predicted NUDIX family NTP pyrophosphohydrolase
MTKRSAGILLYRGEGNTLELLLAHPGGPFWANKDAGAWSIPKGEYDDGEDPLACAIREFREELGSSPVKGPTKVSGLGEIVQPSRKRITGYAIKGEFDPETLKSNGFALEWPPNSGQMQTFPEVDRAAWFAVEQAREKIQPGQALFIERLLDLLGKLPR